MDLNSTFCKTPKKPGFTMGKNTMLPTHCGFCSGGGIYTCPVMFSGTASTVASSSLTGSTSMPWLFIYSQLLVIYSWDGLPTSLLLPVVDFFPNWRSYVCGPKSCDLFQIDNKIMIFLGKNDKLEKTLRPRKINREKRKKKHLRKRLLFNKRSYFFFIRLWDCLLRKTILTCLVP